jgi:CRP-like cAMP-binding protein
MIRSYLVIERGLLEERVFPIVGRIGVGRSPLNAIYLPEPNVSREHAVVYSEGDQTFVEDLGSHNGTFVNAKRVKKAVLSAGDVLRVGNVVLRFRQEEILQSPSIALDQEVLQSTQDLGRSGEEVAESQISIIQDGHGPSQRFRRLREAIARAHPFSTLHEEELISAGRAARLLVFDRGRAIVQQGDRSRSLYIVVDGEVRVFASDHEGREIPLATLSDGQLFGLGSFLTGFPSSTTAQAVEETLLCELSFDALKGLLERTPVFRILLERCHSEAEADIEAKKRSAGLVERRNHQRLNEKLPVSFSVSPTSRVPPQLRGRVFHSISRDISISGVRIKVQDRSLLSLPLGCQVRLEISLQQPWGAIKCLGTLRNMAEGKESQDLGYLGIEIRELPPLHRKKLEQFLYG